MVTLVNPARERMKKNEAALGAGIRHSRHAEIAGALAVAGFDFLFIDLEHSSMALDVASQISAAALHAGIAPIVRVPEGDHNLASRVLDSGALGIVMPHVESAAEAREIVDRQKFPPLGHRSTSGPIAQFSYNGAVAAKEGTQAVNESLLVVVMLETENAISKADEIAAVPGVDVLMIGTGDLTSSLGLHGQFEHERILKAYDTVIKACARHDKWPGMGGVGTEDAMGRYIGRGIRFVLAGNDLIFITQAGTRRTAALRGKEKARDAA
jgi:2-keto-3-deoxy-L-rhamnonate aldolase RhmA